MDHLTGYIQALAKGKSKGKGKGSPGKGGSKGGGKGDGKSGGKGDVFDGNCNHCGKYGHRKNACRQLDLEMAEKGKGIREVGAEDEAEEQDNQQSGDWTLGTMWAITKDPLMQQKPKLQQRVTGSASGARPPVGSGSSNRFACLACADDEAAEFTGSAGQAPCRITKQKAFPGPDKQKALPDDISQLLEQILLLRMCRRG